MIEKSKSMIISINDSLILSAASSHSRNFFSFRSGCDSRGSDTLFSVAVSKVVCGFFEKEK